jgi:hypothetical protein
MAEKVFKQKQGVSASDAFSLQKNFGLMTDSIEPSHR